MSELLGRAYLIVMPPVDLRGDVPQRKALDKFITEQDCPRVFEISEISQAIPDAAARAEHAWHNSGVDQPKDRLSWESEQPVLKQWHRDGVRAALEAAARVRAGITP